MSHQSNSAAGVPRQRVAQPSAAGDSGVDATSTPQSASLDVEATGQTKGYNRFLRLVADAVKFRRRKIAVNTEDDGRIPWSVKLPYAFPQFSLTSLTMLIGIHGTIFYTKIGADVAFIAFFTALARSFDVVTDPVMGYVSDKTRTKWGRRRPYMFGACLFYALCFIMLFSPPKTDSACRARLACHSLRPHPLSIHRLFRRCDLVWYLLHYLLPLRHHWKCPLRSCARSRLGRCACLTRLRWCPTCTERAWPGAIGRCLGT